jgi:ABC-type thiamin/hydroxymethylpyrimidine transport system permease subunit
MNPQTPNPHKGTLKIATTDLVLTALFASLGIASKNILHPLIAVFTGALYVPTGAVAGGLYMMWPVMAYGLIRKRGIASMVSLTQAFISLVMPFGNFGLLSFVIYLAPGLAIDGFLLISRHKACCLLAAQSLQLLQTLSEPFLVGALVLALPLVVLVVSICCCRDKRLASEDHREYSSFQNPKNTIRRKPT